MKALKRVEIICSAPHSKKVIELAKDVGVDGYTLFKNVLGLGSRGLQDADGLHDAFQNNVILIACSEDQVVKLKEPLSKLLTKIGGTCLISDAQWLVH